MRFVITILAAILMAGTAYAQKPTPPEKAAAKVDKTLSKADKAVVKAADKSAAARAPTDDEELALAAMEGLMAQPAERALPIIKKVLAGSQSTLVKRRALFVLSQINGPEALDILTQTARSSDADMRGEAIRSIGIGGDPKALDALQPIYNAGDEDVKGEVLQAWMIAGRKESVYQAALGAKTEEEANDAIRMLGVMGATDELRKLGDKPNAAGGLVQALAISGDLAGLRKIADTNGEHSVRVDAVRSIGIIGSDAARTALREIYSGSTDQEIKEAALQGMMISGDEQGVLTLYRAAKTSDEKRSLMRMLSMMGGDAALEAIDAALEKK
jgi:HEAT repeat protein